MLEKRIPIREIAIVKEQKSFAGLVRFVESLGISGIIQVLFPVRDLGATSIIKN